MHPEVTVLDPPNAIHHLYNRQYMLQDVADLNFSGAYGNSVVFDIICVVARWSLVTSQTHKA